MTWRALYRDLWGLTIFFDFFQVHCEVRSTRVFEGSDRAMLNGFCIVEFVNMCVVDESYVWSTLSHIANVFMLEQLLTFASQDVPQSRLVRFLLISYWQMLKVLEWRVARIYMLGILRCGRDLEVFPLSSCCTLLCVSLYLYLRRDHSKELSACCTTP